MNALSVRSALLPLALALTVAACGDAGSSASSASAAASGEPKKKVEMQDVTNDKLGYIIKLPKELKSSSGDENGGSYGWDTMMIFVEPTEEIAKDDDVHAGADLNGAKVEKKTVGDSFVSIVEKPKSPVLVYGGPKGGKIRARCMAEPDHKDLAVEICSSLRVVKK
jgi:hypothetical protein